jgi:hypothetical protein
MATIREVGEGVHRLVDETGHLIAIFDLSALDISIVIANGLLRAHAAEYGHRTIETQRQAHTSIRKFILFLQEAELQNIVPLPATVGQSFHVWLGKTGLANSTLASVQQVVMVILKWCARNSSDSVSNDLIVRVPRFLRQKPKEKRTVDKDTIKIVLSKCYSKIEKIEARLAMGRTLIDGTYEDKPENQSLAATLKDLLQIGKGSIASQNIVHRSGLSLSRRVEEGGGLVFFRRLIDVTTEDIFPFYLAIVVLTAGNPQAIRYLRRSCIEPHPLRDDLELMSWEKPRSSSEQRRDFSKGKAWSAPSIVRRLMVLNENLLTDCRPATREFVFVGRGTREASPTLISIQSLHNYLADFLKESDLPNFDFKDFRSTAATSLYAQFGEIRIPQKHLNHKFSATTSMYANVQNIPLVIYEKIEKFQGVMVRGNVGQDSVPSDNGDVNGHGISETVFGFGCKDPFAGADGVTPIGQRCLNFTSCSSCKGCVIPLDDPEIISKILAAKVALERGKHKAASHGWMDRFDLLYSDTLDLIERSVLPSVSASVLERASEMIGRQNIPDIE